MTYLNHQTDLQQFPGTFTGAEGTLLTVNDLGNSVEFRTWALDGSGNPNGVVTAKFGRLYKDHPVGDWWIQTTIPEGNTWIRFYENIM